MLAPIVEILLLTFIGSLFPLLGADFPSQVRIRVGYGWILLFVFFLFSKKEFKVIVPRSQPAIFFLIVFIFEIARLLCKFSKGQMNEFYLHGPLIWAFYLGFFIVSFLFFKNKRCVTRLLWLLSWCGFVLALNAIPLLINVDVKTSSGDIPVNPGSYFFPSFLYFHKAIGKYLLGTTGHVNYTGDLMGLGFFPALGLFFYTLRSFKEKKAKTHSLGLPAIFAGTIALAITLFLSRGTLLGFFVALFGFLLAAVIKFPSRNQLGFVGVTCAVVFGLFLWVGHPQKLVKEMQTLKKETSQATETSFSANREAAHRAIAIFRAYPLWGAGTGGYWSLSDKFVSEKYAISGGQGLPVVRTVAMSHYLQVLSEEGVGAFFYYMFILAYFAEILSRLFKIRSRFQFFAGLSLLSAVTMVLLHAAIHFLMEQFSIALLVYMLMGASLRVTGKDFDFN